jgi:hypothetical protein
MSLWVESGHWTESNPFYTALFYDPVWFMAKQRSKPNVEGGAFPALVSPAAAAGEPWPFDSAATGLVEVTDGTAFAREDARTRGQCEPWEHSRRSTAHGAMAMAPEPSAPHSR